MTAGVEIIGAVVALAELSTAIGKSALKCRRAVKRMKNAWDDLTFYARSYSEFADLLVMFASILQQMHDSNLNILQDNHVSRLVEHYRQTCKDHGLQIKKIMKHIRSMAKQCSSNSWFRVRLARVKWVLKEEEFTKKLLCRQDVIRNNINLFIGLLNLRQNVEKAQSLRASFQPVPKHLRKMIRGLEKSNVALRRKCKEAEDRYRWLLLSRRLDITETEANINEQIELIKDHLHVLEARTTESIQALNISSSNHDDRASSYDTGSGGVRSLSTSSESIIRVEASRIDPSSSPNFSQPQPITHPQRKHLGERFPPDQSNDCQANGNEPSVDRDVAENEGQRQEMASVREVIEARKQHPRTPGYMWVIKDDGRMVREEWCQPKHIATTPTEGSKSTTSLRSQEGT